MITQDKKEHTKNASTKYEAHDYEHLIGMPGFSDKLLLDHFKLYQGYVTNTNTTLEKLKVLSKDSKDKATEISEIRRRLGWELNGLRLHEFYFDNLGGNEPPQIQGRFFRLLEAHFGSFDKWKKDFMSAGAMRGIGWVILYRDPQTGNLFNLWIEEHHCNHLAGGTPLLVLDVFEHAYAHDYGTDKLKYIGAFFENVNWEVVAQRVE